MLTTEQKLHNDVFNASEKLLRQAKSIVKKGLPYTDEEVKRIEQLEKLGFRSSQPVQAYQKAKEKLEYQKNMLPVFEYFSGKYPSHKFITKKQVEKICEKYGLLLADAGDYTAEIPEKNQNDIVGFKVDEQDILRPSPIGALEFFVNFEIVLEGDQFVHKRKDGEGISKTTPKDKKPNYIPATGVKILAPVEKLNTKGKKIEGHSLVKDDPIPLQPVHHNGIEGYLIITAWGLEASDENVVNPNHN